jgi:hypothetical protein
MIRKESMIKNKTNEVFLIKIFLKNRYLKYKHNEMISKRRN